MNDYDYGTMLRDYWKDCELPWFNLNLPIYLHPFINLRCGQFVVSVFDCNSNDRTKSGNWQGVHIQNFARICHRLIHDIFNMREKRIWYKHAQWDLRSQSEVNSGSSWTKIKGLEEKMRTDKEGVQSGIPDGSLKDENPFRRILSLAKPRTQRSISSSSLNSFVDETPLI